MSPPIQDMRSTYKKNNYYHNNNGGYRYPPRYQQQNENDKDMANDGFEVVKKRGDDPTPYHQYRGSRPSRGGQVSGRGFQRGGYRGNYQGPRGGELQPESSGN